MNTILKILVIFVVAVLVGGMFYGVVTAASSGTDQSSMPERPADSELAPPERTDASDGIQFPVEVIKNLVIISVVSLIYLKGPKLLGKKKPVLQVARQ
jgi:hypothetical protein